MFANSENPDEPSHQDFHCLVCQFIFFIPAIKICSKQGRSPNLPDVRRYPTLP